MESDRACAENPRACEHTVLARALSRILFASFRLLSFPLFLSFSVESAHTIHTTCSFCACNFDRERERKERCRRRGEKRDGFCRKCLLRGRGRRKSKEEEDAARARAAAGGVVREGDDGRAIGGPSEANLYLRHHLRAARPDAQSPHCPTGLPLRSLSLSLSNSCSFGFRFCIFQML